MTQHSAFSIQHFTHTILTITLLVILAACGKPAPTAVPGTPKPTLVPSATLLPTIQNSPTDEPTLTPSETPIPATYETHFGEAVPPPISITLPAGWQSGSDAIILPSDQYRSVPIAVYRGPVTGGTGTIVLLWGFPNMAVNPFDSDQNALKQVLWGDGLRLLRLAVLEQGCNVGTDLQRDFPIGDLVGSGTGFSAVSCPELPDTRGWFVAVQVNRINFAFFVYAEPIKAMDTAQDELQAILNSVRFHVPEVGAPTATLSAPEATPTP